MGLTISLLAMMNQILSYKLFVIGRIIFGTGMVGTLIWYSCINTIFFFYDNNAMSMAILVCFTAFGETVANLVLPLLYEQGTSISDTMMVPIYL